MKYIKTYENLLKNPEYNIGDCIMFFKEVKEHGGSKKAIKGRIINITQKNIKFYFLECVKDFKIVEEICFYQDIISHLSDEESKRLEMKIDAIKYNL